MREFEVCGKKCRFRPVLAKDGLKIKNVFLKNANKTDDLSSFSEFDDMALKYLEVVENGVSNGNLTIELIDTIFGEKSAEAIVKISFEFLDYIQSFLSNLPNFQKAQA